MIRNEDNARVSTLYELAKSSLRLFDVFTAVKMKVGEKYKSYTYERLFEDAASIGRALRRRKLTSKHVIIFGNNSYDWVRAYFAVGAHCGTVLPLPLRLSADELADAAKRCDACAIIYDDAEKEKLDSLPECVLRIAFSELDRLASEGSFNDPDDEEYVPSADSVAEIAYTLGTDGSPKAAMLTHESVCFTLRELNHVMPIGSEDSLYSILPISHAYERICGMLYPIYSGASVAYGEGLRHLTSNLKVIQPTAILCVPVVLEKIYEKIWKNIEKKGIGEKVRRVIKLTEAAGPLKDSIRREVFAEIHDSLGGRLSYIISGAGVADEETVSGFAEFGIKVLQGYGMTECAALISLNRPELYELNSAGLPVSHGLVDIYNIQSDGIGEIRYKGKNVMKGYYKDTSDNTQLLRNGWLYTGDMGYFDRRGFLHIVGRRANMITNAKSKQIFPEEIEHKLCKSPFIAESVVVAHHVDGGNDLELVAVICPDTSAFEELYGIAYTDSALKKELGNAVRNVNSELKKYKQIHKFVIRREPFVKNEAGAVIRAGIAEETAAMLAKQ